MGGRLVTLLLVALALSGCTTEPEDAPSQAADAAGLPASILLAQEHFEGMLPAPETGPEALFPQHVVTAPEGAQRIVVTYNSTYTGAFPSYLNVTDPDGASASTNLDACPTGLRPGIDMAYSCTLDMHHAMAGPWTLGLTWQVGEVMESYTLDVTVWGVPDDVVPSPEPTRQRSATVPA